MNRSITNTNIFNLTQAELNSIPTFDQLIAEYKNSQIPSNHVFKEDVWKYKFDKVGNNKTTGVGIRKCNVLYPALKKTKDAIIIEKGQFVNGKLNGDNCIKAIKDLYGNTTIYMGQFVDGEPKGRIIQIYQSNNNNFKQATIGTMFENMKFAGQTRQYLCDSYSNIAGTTLMRPSTVHKDCEQLWFLRNKDKKDKDTKAMKLNGDRNTDVINILNAKKQRTSIQMLKKLPLAKTTKHLKILLDNSQQNILNTKIIAESIKEKMDKINKKNKVNKQSLSSIYLSYVGNKYGYDDIMESMRSLITNNISKYCFFSKIKDEYRTKLQPHVNGAKRIVINDDNNPIELEDMAKVPNKYKEYYCVYKDITGTIKQLMVPHDLVRNRVELIDLGKFDEALNTLQKGKTYTFTSNNLNYQLRPYDLEKNIKYGEAQPWKDCNNSSHTTLTDYYEAGIIKGKESSTCHSN